MWYQMTSHQPGERKMSEGETLHCIQCWSIHCNDSHVTHKASVLCLHQHVPDVVGVVGHGCG